MNRGMIIFGAPGCGTSTVGRVLAKELRFSHIETDDISGQKIDVPPFRLSRPLVERIELLQAAIVSCDGFVISGSMWDWGESFVPLFDLAVFITASTSVRVERLERREQERYGERICEGGDMYDSHSKFIEWAKAYDADNPDRSLKLHEAWIDTLPCPVMRVDGSISVSENVTQILGVYHDLLSNKAWQG